MGKSVVIYESKYGATKKYAEWIGKTLNIEVYSKREFKAKDLLTYDTIIFGGGLYGGSVRGASLISKNFQKIKDKNIIVFTCGLADPMNEENIKGIHIGLDRTFDKDMKAKIKFFNFRGAIDYKELSILHKAMMAMFIKVLRKKPENSLKQDDKELLDTYGQSVDFTDEKTITPLVRYVQGFYS